MFKPTKDEKCKERRKPGGSGTGRTVALERPYSNSTSATYKLCVLRLIA